MGCYDKVQTIVQDAPKEQCSLEPQRTCKHVTKLVPKLTPTEEGVDVPKEVCTRLRSQLSRNGAMCLLRSLAWPKNSSISSRQCLSEQPQQRRLLIMSLTIHEAE